jgi:hypothetical protein
MHFLTPQSCTIVISTGGEMRPLSYHQNGVPTPDAGNWRRSHMELGQQQQGLCAHCSLHDDVKVLDILRNVLHFQFAPLDGLV